MNDARALRILHLASSERWTGAAEPVVSLALHQQAAGHRVWIGCVPGRSFERKARERGAEVLEGLHLNRRLHPAHLLQDLVFLRGFCKKNAIDIVHCHLLHDHWLAAVALPGPRRRRKGSAPRIVRTLHGSLAPRTDLFHRWLFRRGTDRLVTLSAEAARRAAETLALACEAVPFVRGGVDLERFRPDRDGGVLRHRLGIPAEAPLAGIVTRMRAGRGIRWLMRAMPAVLEKTPDAHLVVVGRGEQKKWFREEMRKPEYAGQVHYAGYLKDDALADAYVSMDASLFLGLGSEGTCRAILEAMASATPTIGADIGAVPEIVDNGRTGFLVKHRSVEDLTEKIAAALSNRENLHAMGRRARERAEQHFSEETRGHAFLEIYRSLFPDSAGT